MFPTSTNHLFTNYYSHGQSTYLFLISITPVEVIERLKARENPPFRPNIKNTTLGNMDLRDTLALCWNDGPEQRPDVGKLKVLIRELSSR